MSKSLISFTSATLSPKSFFEGLNLQDRVYNSKMLTQKKNTLKTVEFYRLN